MNERGGTSPWVWVGLGCVLAVVLAVGTLAALGFFAFRRVERFAAELSDPEARGAKVQQLLGYREPPPGYYPAVSFSIPMLLRVAILSDQPAGPEGDPLPGSRTFVFVEVRDFGNDQQEVRDYVEGRSDHAGLFERTQVNVGGHRELGSPRPEAFARGAFAEAGVTYRWASYRADQWSPAGGSRGLETLVLVECPRADRRVRLAVWSAPLPGDPAEPIGEQAAAGDGDADGLEVAGTPADEDALRAFLGQLRLCP